MLMASMTTMAHDLFERQNLKPDSPASTLIILHGILASKSNVKDLATLMIGDQRRFGSVGRIVTVDLPNHGASSHLTAVKVCDVAEEVKKLMEKLEIPRASLLGHSYGGKIAMAFALMWPEMVDRLVVEDIDPQQTPPEVGDMLELVLQKMSAMTFPPTTEPVSKTLQKTMNKLADVCEDEAFRRHIVPSLLEPDAETNQLVWKLNFDNLKSKMHDALVFPEFQTSCNCLALFVYGELSDVVQPSNHGKIRELFPNAKIIGIPGIGHFVHQDKRLEFLEALAEIL